HTRLQGDWSSDVCSSDLLFVHRGSKVAKAAVVSDVRGGSYFDGLAAMLDDLQAHGVSHRVLFLQAGEQALLNRYKETRRRHPLRSEERRVGKEGRARWAR